LAEAFLRSLEVERNASLRTVTAYRGALDTFKMRPGMPEWLDCSPVHFREFLFACMKEGKARTYIRLL